MSKLINSIDVRGLPEPLVQALQRMVQALRGELPPDTQDTPARGRQKIKLPVWPGKVIGSLSRHDIYGDAL